MINHHYPVDNMDRKIRSLACRPLNTFDQVVAAYESIKPVDSAQYAGLARDIRPLGARRRRWERVEKIGDNKYILHDAAVAGTAYYGTPTPAQLAFERALAPIVWERHIDGDYVRLRNVPRRVTSICRPRFFEAALPWGLYFESHVVAYTANEGPMRFLPLPKPEAEFDYGAQRTLCDDGVALWFKQVRPGVWERAGDAVPVKTSRIDREEKGRWTKRIESFYEWMCAVAPVTELSYAMVGEQRSALREYMSMVDRSNTTRVWLSDAHDLPTWLAREILSDPEHELRTAFMVVVAYSIELDQPVTNKEKAVAIRRNFVRLMNKIVGLHKIDYV